MLKCEFCGTLQHGPYYQIPHEDMVPTRHCCLICSTAEGEARQCSNPNLVREKYEDLPWICLTRRLVAALSSRTQELDVHWVETSLGLDRDTSISGEMLIKKFVNDKILIELGEIEKVRWIVDQQALEATLPMYLGIGKQKVG